MRVLFVSHEDSKFGAPKSLMKLVQLLKDNYNVEPVMLLHSKDDVYKFCKKENIECYITGHRNFIAGKKGKIFTYLKIIPKWMINKAWDHRALMRLRKRGFDFNSIDLIHTNVSSVSLGNYLGEKLCIPHIVHLRESTDNLDSCIVCKFDYIRYFNKHVTAFIAISEYCKRSWVSKGLDLERIFLVYNGLDITNYSHRKTINNRIRIVMSSAIQREKRQDVFIRAISMLPDEIKKRIDVDIIGSGESDYIDEIERLIEKKGLQAIVHMRGYIECAASLFSNYDIGVVTSCGEAFGRVTIEFMLNELAVIGSDAGANPELIVNGETGYLFRVDDDRDLCSKIITLVNDSEEICRLGINGRNRVLSSFTDISNAREVYRVYEGVREMSIRKRV